MAAKPLLPVSDALDAIKTSITTLPAERIAISKAHRRYTADIHKARLSHPASDVSAMDGYAVRSEDVVDLPTNLKVIDESAAGKPATAAVQQGQAIRIFTGAVMPKGADCIILQEDTIKQNSHITIAEASDAGKFIRKTGQDFKAGDVLIPAGKQLTARDIALLASAGIDEVLTLPAPRVAIVNSGDELVEIGITPKHGQLVNSNGAMLAAMITAFGGEAVDLGSLPDKSGALEHLLHANGAFDLIVTTGGASVGEHDHIIGDLQNHPQSKVNFWRIAMRPGKPLIFADWDGVPLLGLPGNPVSTGVCALLFVQAAIAKLQGRHLQHDICSARLSTPLPENDKREDYIRTNLSVCDDRVLIATPAEKQDSAMLSFFAKADGLIIRPPFAKALGIGEEVQVIRFPTGF